MRSVISQAHIHRNDGLSFDSVVHRRQNSAGLALLRFSRQAAQKWPADWRPGLWALVDAGMGGQAFWAPTAKTAASSFCSLTQSRQHLKSNFTAGTLPGRALPPSLLPASTSSTARPRQALCFPGCISFRACQHRSARRFWPRGRCGSRWGNCPSHA